MMFVILVESLLSFTINNNVFYTHEKTGFLKRTDVSMFSESEKNLYFDTHGVFLPEIQERRTKRPILRTLMFETDQSVLDDLVKRYGFEHYVQKKRGTYVTIPNTFNFSKTFSEITLVENIRDLNVVPYSSIASKSSLTFEHKNKHNRHIHNKRNLQLSSYNDTFINYQKACFEVIQHPILTSSHFETGMNVHVHVVDAFVSPTHDDVKYTIAPFENGIDIETYINYTYAPTIDISGFQNDVYHGVHVIGTIGAIPNNGLGIVGMAPSTNITFRTFLDDSYNNSVNNGLLYSSTDICPGLNFIAEIDDEIVNNVYSNSWGLVIFIPYRFSDYFIDDLINSKRKEKGAILVFAAGNGDVLEPAYITWYNMFKHTIVVGSVDSDGSPSEFTSRGTNLVVSAMGNIVLSTTSDYDNEYNSYEIFTSSFGILSGTSMATPQVTSAIAMVLEHNPYFSSRDIKKMLMKSAYQPNLADFTQNAAGNYFSDRLGAGVLNVTKLLQVSKEWKPLPEEKTFDKTVFSCYDNESACPTFSMNGQTFTVNVTENIPLETVQLVFDASHPWVLGFEIVLESPWGTKSTLAEIIPPETQTPTSLEYNAGLNEHYDVQDVFKFSIYSSDYTGKTAYDYDFKFLSNSFLDEFTAGEWKIHIKGIEISDECNDYPNSLILSSDYNGKCNDGTFFEDTDSFCREKDIETDCVESVLCNPLTDATDCGTDEGSIRKLNLIFNGADLPNCTSTNLLNLFEKTGDQVCTDVLLSLFDVFEVTEFSPRYTSFVCNCYNLIPESIVKENNCYLEPGYTIKELLEKDILGECETIAIQLNVSKLENSSVQRCCGKDCTLTLNSDFYEITNQVLSEQLE